MSAITEIFYSLDGGRRVQRVAHPGWATYIVEQRGARANAWTAIRETHSRHQALTLCAGA